MPETKQVDVLIVGAGFAGICMGIKLREAGMESFLIIEKHDDIGGTWYLNTYPGCACDVPSHLYSYSFAKNPSWSRMYSGQQEIEDYLKHCVHKYGLAPWIRTSTPLRAASWNETASMWEVRAGDMIIHARVLVSAVGALHVPSYPNLPGIETFAGSAFHSAEWDHRVDLKGRRIGVIGTGASAIQFVPQIAPAAETLYLFQRTAAWILPKLDFAIADKWKRRFHRIPGVMAAFRLFIFLSMEVRVLAFLGNKFMRNQGEKLANSYRARKVSDPLLRAKLTPNYVMGCKRVLFTNDFYQGVQRENVHLVTEGIREVRAHSVVTNDGVERPVDVLIYGTGFRVTEPLVGINIYGRRNLEIHQAWQRRMSAYLGIAVHGFPNFFILLGPNTGLGHNSVVLMIEAQVNYVVKCLKVMKLKRASVMEIKREPQAEFETRTQARLSRTVWQTGGCRSWYQDQRTGENASIWPGSVLEYIWRTRTVNAAHYTFIGEDEGQQRECTPLAATV
jgi:cation diffusion facilitator CzcD-associated flavoprotein CzcO